MFPEEFRSPPDPNAALEFPGGTSEHLQERIDRARANRGLFHAADRDLKMLARGSELPRRCVAFAADREIQTIQARILFEQIA